MRTSGRQHFNKAVRSYDEKLRRLWIFDYPAQAALCGIQIWWTNETNDAFAHLELGHENALKDYNKKQVKLLFLHQNIEYLSCGFRKYLYVLSYV